MPKPSDHSTLKPPGTSLKGRYVLLAIGVHVLLLAALSMNFYWRSETPPPAQAELWTAMPNVTPQHSSNPTLPRVTPHRAPPAETPPSVTQDADLALERARQERERQEAERLAQAQRAEHERAQQEAARQEAQRQAEQQRAEQERERQEAERKAAEEQARQEAAKLEAQRQEAERKAAAERARQEAARQQAQREAAEREALRQQQLANMHSALGGSGNSTSGSSGPIGGNGNASASYRNRLAGIIKRNVIYNSTTNNNPETLVYVETDNTGKITLVRITRSSGDQAWDEAVERALWKTDQLPADTDGSRPDTKFNFRFRPQD